MHCELSYKFISTNKCTILYVMYFNIILLLQVSAQSPSSGANTNVVKTYSNKMVLK